MTLKHQRDKAIGVIIRSARVKKSMRQQELAKHMGLNNPNFVSLVERGLSTLPLKYLKLYRRVLGVQDSEILNLHSYFHKQMMKQEVENGVR